MMAPRTRDRLIEATQAILAEDGWAATTTRRVAQRANVNPGLVHYHAGTIEQLRRDATLQALRDFFSGEAELDTSRTDLRRWLGALLDPTSSTPDQDRTMRILLESLTPASQDASFGKQIAALLSSHRALLAERLDDLGVRNAVAIAATLSAIVDGALLQRTFDNDLDLTPIIDVLEGLITQNQEPRQGT